MWVLRDFKSRVILDKGAVIRKCRPVEEREEFQEAGRKISDYIRTWLQKVRGLERTKAKRLLEKVNYDCGKSVERTGCAG